MDSFKQLLERSMYAVFVDPSLFARKKMKGGEMKLS